MNTSATCTHPAVLSDDRFLQCSQYLFLQSIFSKGLGLEPQSLEPGASAIGVGPNTNSSVVSFTPSLPSPPTSVGS